MCEFYKKKNHSMLTHSTKTKICKHSKPNEQTKGIDIKRNFCLIDAGVSVIFHVSQLKETHRLSKSNKIRLNANRGVIWHTHHIFLLLFWFQMNFPLSVDGKIITVTNISMCHLEFQHLWVPIIAYCLCPINEQTEFQPITNYQKIFHRMHDVKAFTWIFT